MTIVFHRNADGKIARCYKINMNEECAQRATEKYNLEHPDELVEFIVAEEGSVEEFLFLQSERRMKLDMETLRDLENAVNEANSLISYLIDRAEEMRT